MGGVSGSPVEVVEEGGAAVGPVPSTLSPALSLSREREIAASPSTLSPALSLSKEIAASRTLSFAGYAAVFDRVDRAGDVVRRGAFAGAGVAPLLWNHSGSPVGEVRVLEDARGLRVEGVVRGVTLEVGAGLSVGYRVRRSRQGVWRELLDVELLEVSLVRAPCQVLARVDRVGG